MDMRYPWERDTRQAHKGELNDDGSFVFKDQWQEPAEVYHASIVDSVGILGHNQVLFNFQGPVFDRHKGCGIGGRTLRMKESWPDKAIQWLRKHHPNFNDLGFSINQFALFNQVSGADKLPSYDGMKARFDPPRGNGVQHSWRNPACLRVKGADFAVK